MFISGSGWEPAVELFGKNFGSSRSSPDERFGFSDRVPEHRLGDVIDRSPRFALRRSVGADERAAAGAGFGGPVPLQVAIGSCHGVRVDGEIDGERLDGRQLLARCQGPQCDGPLYLLDELEVERDTASRIDDEDCGHYVCFWSSAAA